MTAARLPHGPPRPASLAPTAVGALARRCLERELETWPKPGLVSPGDPGAHEDMDADAFRRSAAALEPFFAALARAGGEGARMDRLRAIGIEAEAAMMAATGGVNTHRGAIFAIGLLCAAAGFRQAFGLDVPLGRIVQARWAGGILDGPILLHSHGEAARKRFGAGGARQQAADGFPLIYRVGLPAFAEAIAATGEARRAAVQAIFALVAALDDTNLLHRGGPDGLAFAQCAAQGFLDAGGVTVQGWEAEALAIHHAFVARRLSPGGAADLLAATLFVQAIDEASSC
jgi:triphosphoribosyl-dephospho-CoA synthase